MQHFFVNLLFVVMIFVGTFHGMTDARHHQKQKNKLYQEYINHHYRDGYNRGDRFG